MNQARYGKQSRRQRKTPTIPISGMVTNQITSGEPLNEVKSVGQCRYSKLNHLLNEWETKGDFQTASHSEWQKVRELIGEIRSILPSIQSDWKKCENGQRRLRRRFGRPSELFSDIYSLQELDREKDFR